MIHFDILIVGAGPGGLSAARRLTGRGLTVALVDRGRSVGKRERHHEHDMTNGHGGAGLFSDGKFSFFPSASGLWTLLDEPALRNAYDWTAELLSRYGLNTPPFPSDPAGYSVDLKGWTLKDYPSDYLSLRARLDLTSGIVDEVDAEIMVETEVQSAEYRHASDFFDVKLRNATNKEFAVTARRLVLASGRFGPLALHRLTEERAFRRLEVGLRLEQPAELAFFRDMKQLDPKLRFADQKMGVEWRTFCACRNGETVLTKTEGLWTVSGRSDCPPTERSNIGFNTRILDPIVACRTLTPALTAMAQRDCHFVMPMTELLNSSASALSAFDRVYGCELRDIIRRGLFHLSERFPEILTAETRLIGPTLEGVGWYPKLDGQLRLRDVPAWAVGDACGLFRGIVAALMSGHYAASAALRDWETIK